jgi:hypothetical protein
MVITKPKVCYNYLVLYKSPFLLFVFVPLTPRLALIGRCRSISKVQTSKSHCIKKVTGDSERPCRKQDAAQEQGDKDSGHPSSFDNQRKRETLDVVNFSLFTNQESRVTRNLHFKNRST